MADRKVGEGCRSVGESVVEVESPLYLLGGASQDCHIASSYLTSVSLRLGAERPCASMPPVDRIPGVSHRRCAAPTSRWAAVARLRRRRTRTGLAAAGGLPRDLVDGGVPCQAEEGGGRADAWREHGGPAGQPPCLRLPPAPGWPQLPRPHLRTRRGRRGSWGPRPCRDG